MTKEKLNAFVVYNNIINYIFNLTLLLNNLYFIYIYIIN